MREFIKELPKKFYKTFCNLLKRNKKPNAREILEHSTTPFWQTNKKLFVKRRASKTQNNKKDPALYRFFYFNS